MILDLGDADIHPTHLADLNETPPDLCRVEILLPVGRGVHA
jgi:hypothetical protein